MYFIVKLEVNIKLGLTSLWSLSRTKGYSACYITVANVFFLWRVHNYGHNNQKYNISLILYLYHATDTTNYIISALALVMSHRFCLTTFFFTYDQNLQRSGR